MPTRSIALLLGSTLVAQQATVKERFDPWTRGEPERMAVVGIEAWGPMPWADHHSTADIDVELGDDPAIRWVETRHFKIGVGLRDRPLPPDRKERTEFLAEVKELRRELKGMKAPREIDSWLLALLYSRRLEELYADFCRRAGFADTAAPCDGHGHDGLGFRERGGFGTGPFLGQHGKFCVLVLERRGDLSRYFTRFAGRDAEEGTCHHFIESNSLVYVTTPDVRTKALPTERALWCNIVYGVVRNFVTGFRGYTYEIPVWNVEGLAHWYRRRIDPAYNSLAALPQSQWGLLHDADWEVKSRARVETGAWLKGDELLQLRLQDLKDFHQHVMMWSRVDFLMAQGEEKYAKYLHELKALPSFGVVWEQVLAQQEQALQLAYGLDVAGFDAAWQEWVEANYEFKRR